MVCLEMLSNERMVMGFIKSFLTPNFATSSPQIDKSAAESQNKDTMFFVSPTYAETQYFPRFFPVALIVSSSSSHDRGGRGGTMEDLRQSIRLAV